MNLPRDRADILPCHEFAVVCISFDAVSWGEQLGMLSCCRLKVWPPVFPASSTPDRRLLIHADRSSTEVC